MDLLPVQLPLVNHQLFINQIMVQVLLFGWLRSMVLVDMVCSHGNSVTFYSPISHQLTDLVGLLYVDNCNIFAIDKDGQTPHTVISKLHFNIDLWQGGLASTGGSLSQKSAPGVYWQWNLRENPGPTIPNTRFQLHCLFKTLITTPNPFSILSHMKAFHGWGYPSTFWEPKNSAVGTTDKSQ